MNGLFINNLFYLFIYIQEKNIKKVTNKNVDKLHRISLCISDIKILDIDNAIY